MKCICIKDYSSEMHYTFKTCMVYKCKCIDLIYYDKGKLCNHQYKVYRNSVAYPLSISVFNSHFRVLLDS